MPNKWSAKRERQYEHIKEGAIEQGKSEERAKEIAARTVNKQRREDGGVEPAVPAAAAGEDDGLARLERNGRRKRNGAHGVRPLPAVERSCAANFKAAWRGYTRGRSARRSSPAR